MNDETTIRNRWILDNVFTVIGKEDVVGIMLTGSYADNTQNKESDIDIVVLSKSSNRQTTAEINKNGTPLHFLIFPRNKVFELIYDDIIRERFVFYSIFQKGLVILDQEGILHSLKSTLCGIKPSLSERTINNLLHGISENLAYIKRNTDAIGVALKAYIYAEQLIVGLLSPQCKYLDKKMKSFPQQRKELNNALNAFMLSHDADKFSTSILKALNTICTLSKDYSSTNARVDFPTDEDFLIFIPEARVYDKVARNLIIDLYQKNPEIKIFAYYVGNCNMQERGTYIAIPKTCNKKLYIANYIREHTSKTKFQVIPDVYFAINTSFFYFNLFGDNKYQKEVYQCFTECSKWMIDVNYKDNIKERGIKLGYILTFILFRFLGPQSRTFADILQMFYIPDSININGLVPYAMLTIRYKRLLANLSRNFIDKKNEIQMELDDLCQSEMYDLEKIEKICHTIIRISSYSHKMPYNVQLFQSGSYSILYNIYNQILSIFSLDSYQKLTICHNCSKLLN